MYTKIKNINYHYDVRGDKHKPAVVFINSLGTDFRIWDGVLEHLADEFCYLRYDLPGHGLSDRASQGLSIDEHAEVLKELIDGLGFSQVFVCGISVGGLIAQALSLSYPEKIKGLVLSNTGYKIGDENTWNDRIAAIEAQGLDFHSSDIMERWFSDQFRANEASAVSIYRNMLLTTDIKGYAAVCSAIRDANFKDRVANIAVPTVCIAGGKDQATPTDIVVNLSSVIPGSKLITFDGAGHLPCLEDPVRFASVLRDHFRSCSADHSAKEDSYDLGMKVRRSVLGNGHVDRAEREKSSLDDIFQEYIVRGAWGSVWSRNQLTKRERSLLTIALLAALGHDEELAMHIRATINTGASKQDVREVLLHAGVYAGVPVSNKAFKIAKEIYEEIEEGSS